MADWSDQAAQQQLPRMFRSHVERCLQDIWEQAELHTDLDGDWPYRSREAQCWVALVEEGPHSSVRVFAFAAMQLKATAAVLREINDLNSRVRWVRIYLEHHILTVEAQIPWAQLDRATLEHAMGAVATVADDIGALFATVHGGYPVFAAAPDLMADEAADGDEEAA